MRTRGSASGRLETVAHVQAIRARMSAAQRDPASGKRATFKELVRFSLELLRLDLLFCGTEAPCYSWDMPPYLREHALHD